MNFIYKILIFSAVGPMVAFATQATAASPNSASLDCGDTFGPVKMAPAPLRIPFEYIDGFIIVDIRLQQVLPLKFIFDTGSQQTILTEAPLLAFTGLEVDEPIRIVGSDLSVEIEGSLVRRSIVEVGNLTLSSQPLIILEDDRFDLRELTGQPVSGILGVGAFAAYVITIDYSGGMITLSQNSPLAGRKRTVELPLTIVRHKAYLDVKARVHPGYTDSLKLLIDTGASLEMLMHADPEEQSLYPPKLVISEIGYGLGGSLMGYVGRSDTVALGRFNLTDVVTHFQTLDSDSLRTPFASRGGIIGNRLLERFLVSIDYPSRKLFLRPKRGFKRRRPYDLSGLRLVTESKDSRGLRVQLVVASSPAAELDIRPGDLLTHINGIPTRLFQLDGARRRLRRKPGRKLKLRIARDGQRLDKTLILKELI